jgi:thiamine pyrophosphate-dependent acetolactate synthase large subunit-like protein
VPARDWFAGEPFALGIAGGLSTPAAARLLAEADCVVAVGASLDAMTTRFGALFESATIIRISGPDRAAGRVDIQLTGDARACLRAWLSLLDAERSSPTAGYRSDRVAALLRDAQREDDDEAEVEAGLLDPAAVVRAIDEMVPQHAIIANSIGHYWWFPMTGFARRRPDSYLTPYEFGVMGQAFPVATGAAFATQRPVVVLEGDGGFATNIQELETVAREHADLFLVVMNDGAYGAEVEFLRRNGRSPELAIYGYIDICAVAEAFGVANARVNSIDELRRAYAGKKSGEALVVDVRIPAAYIPRRLEAVVRSRSEAA